MLFEYDIDLGDLIPDSGAPCEAEVAMCDECAKDLAEVDGMCADCAREMEAENEHEAA